MLFDHFDTKWQHPCGKLFKKMKKHVKTVLKMIFLRMVSVVATSKKNYLPQSGQRCTTWRLQLVN